MKYSENRCCPKCGHGVVSTGYSYGLMKRQCQRCGYQWNEEPLDSEDEIEGEV